MAGGWRSKPKARRLKRAIDATHDKETSKPGEENLQKTEETAADLTAADKKAA